MSEQVWWWARAAAWTFCLISTGLGARRLVQIAWRTPRYLDPIWGVVFLLALNRLAYMTHISQPAADGTAFALALAMGDTSLWYQRSDR